MLALQGYRDGEVDAGEQADRGPAVPGLPADDLPGVQADGLLAELVIFLDPPPGRCGGDQLGQRVRPGRPAPTALLQEIVEELQLGEVLDVRPSSLSHGVARLVGIARALVTEPAVLLLDEPAAGLDTNESTELGRTIRELAKRRGIGVLVVEHDVPLILQTCDRIVALDFGHTIAEGTPDAISHDARVIEAYLGTSDSTVSLQPSAPRGPAA